MGCPVSGLFSLVLRVPPKLTPDIVNKGLGASEVLTKKGFELRLLDRCDALVAALVLSLSEADGAMEECGGKRNTIYSCGI